MNNCLFPDLKDNIMLNSFMTEVFIMYTFFKDTDRQKAPPNKTPTNMDIWVVGKSSQLFIRGS